MWARTSTILIFGLFSTASSLSDDGSRLACINLSHELPNEVFNSGTAGYSDSLASYFSLQEQELSPSCVVQPKTSTDVIKIVATMNTFFKLGAQFAIRSGGHTPHPGAANIDKGVTIDLSRLSQIKVSQYQGSVIIGPGARWSGVWKVLDPLNISIAGGRDSNVGVGGYTLGGGISYLGPILGWACDNVIEYEVVLASGKLATVNERSYPDLFIALKGGSSNFGIVTSFKYKTYPLGKFWGGFVAYESSEATQQVEALSQFMGAEPYDPHASMIQTYGNHAGGVIISNGLAYTKPSEYPTIFKSLANKSTAVSNHLRLDTMASFANETDSYQTCGKRQNWFTTTFAHDPEIYSTIYSLWNSSLAGVSAIEGINWFLTLQPTPALGNKNSLGIDPADKRLCIALIITWHTNEADDQAVRTAIESLFASIDVATKSRSVYRSFRYLNYADAVQPVIASYGAESDAYLKSLSQKYDPGGLFQRGVPGGFKVFAT